MGKSHHDMPHGRPQHLCSSHFPPVFVRSSPFSSSPNLFISTLRMYAKSVQYSVHPNSYLQIYLDPIFLPAPPPHQKLCSESSLFKDMINHLHPFLHFSAAISLTSLSPKLLQQPLCYSPHIQTLKHPFSVDMKRNTHYKMSTYSSDITKDLE